MNTNSSAKTVLCFGDSNTWGQKPDQSGRYPADVRWTGVLQQQLGDTYYVIEEGLGSRTTNVDYLHKPGYNGQTYLGPCLDSHAPVDLVILMLGTNDLKIEFNRGAPEIAAATRELLSLIQTKTGRNKHPTAQVIVVSPILIDDSAPSFTHFYTGTYDHTSIIKSQVLAPELQKVAAEAGCRFVDAAAVAHTGVDGMHLTEASHAALGALLTPEVQAMLT